MADPVTILAISSAVVGGVSTIQQGRIAKAQGEADKKIAEYNAEQADRAAKAKLESAKIQSDRISRQEKFVQAANRAKAAKSGISLSESPSTIEALADTAFQFHLDRNFTLNQGMQDYISTQAQASLLRAEGAFAKEQGKSVYTNSLIAGGAQIGMGVFAATYKPKPPTTMAQMGTKTNSYASYTQIPGRSFS